MNWCHASEATWWWMEGRPTRRTLGPHSPSTASSSWWVEGWKNNSSMILHPFKVQYLEHECSAAYTFRFIEYGRWWGSCLDYSISVLLMFLVYGSIYWFGCGWLVLQALLQVQGGCRRCQMVCVVPGTGQRTREPMLSLASARGSSMLFGVHASAPGAAEERVVSIGTAVEVTMKWWWMEGVMCLAYGPLRWSV